MSKSIEREAPGAWAASVKAQRLVTEPVSGGMAFLSVECSHVALLYVNHTLEEVRSEAMKIATELYPTADGWEQHDVAVAGEADHRLNILIPRDQSSASAIAMAVRGGADDKR